VLGGLLLPGIGPFIGLAVGAAVGVGAAFAIPFIVALLDHPLWVAAAIGAAALLFLPGAAIGAAVGYGIGVLPSLVSGVQPTLVLDGVEVVTGAVLFGMAAAGTATSATSLVATLAASE
jgi:hypothetical protein